MGAHHTLVDGKGGSLDHLNRTVNWSENSLRRIRGNGFRTYIHPPDSMIGVAAADGMRGTYREHSRNWDVVGLVR